MKQYIYSAIAGETVTETETETETATTPPTGGVTATATVTQTETDPATYYTPPPAPPDPGGDCAGNPICSGADPDNKDDSGESSCIDATTCCPTAHFMLYGDGGLLNTELEPGNTMPVVFTGEYFDLDMFKDIYDAAWEKQNDGVVEDTSYIACSDEEDCGTKKLCRYGVAWRAIIKQGTGAEAKWYGQVKWCLFDDLCEETRCEDCGTPDTLYVYVPEGLFTPGSQFAFYEGWHTLTQDSEFKCRWITEDETVLLMYPVNGWLIQISPECTPQPTCSFCFWLFADLLAGKPCEPWGETTWAGGSHAYTQCTTQPRGGLAEDWSQGFDIAFIITAEDPLPT